MILPPAETLQTEDIPCSLHRKALVVCACLSGGFVLAVAGAVAWWMGWLP